MTAKVGAQASVLVLSGIHLDHNTDSHPEWDSRLEAPVQGHIRMKAGHGQEHTELEMGREHMDSERD